VKDPQRVLVLYQRRPDGNNNLYSTPEACRAAGVNPMTALRSE
jgi:hypothetical protein